MLAPMGGLRQPGRMPNTSMICAPLKATRRNIPVMGENDPVRSMDQMGFLGCLLKIASRFYAAFHLKCESERTGGSPLS